jgi:hypothetical protein
MSLDRIELLTGLVAPRSKQRDLRGVQMLLMHEREFMILNKCANDLAREDTPYQGCMGYNVFIPVTNYAFIHNYISFVHLIKTHQGAKADHVFNYQICSALDLGENLTPHTRYSWLVFFACFSDATDSLSTASVQSNIAT